MDATYTVTYTDTMTGRSFDTFVQAEDATDAARMVTAAPLIKNSFRVTRVVKGGSDPRES